MKLLVICLCGPIALLALDSALRSVFLCIGPWCKNWSQVAVDKTPLLSYGLVIPAHNEASTIDQMIGSLRQINYPSRKYQVFVIADNCTDETAVVARTKGAYCLERFDSANPGKGKTIQWFLREAANVLHLFDAIVIFDADSQVDPAFLQEINKAFVGGAPAVQGFVLPVPAQRSPVSSLAAYSELLAQKIEDTARSRLGWPVPLRGTGMAFRIKMLRESAPSLRTKAEDVEMTLLIAGNGRIAFAPEAIVYDPKPSNVARVATQRARWLQSQGEIWRYYWRDILYFLVRGNIGEKALLFSLLLKPKAMIFSLKVMFLGLFLVFPFPSAWLRNTIVVLLSGAILADIAYYIIGLAFVEDPRFYTKALLAAPLYALMWLWGIIVALLSKEPWLRARD